MMRSALCILLLVSVPVSTPVSAAELLSLDFERDGDSYRIETLMRLDAAPDRVAEILTDYPNLSRVDGFVVESRLIGRDRHGRPEVYTRLRGCLAFYCPTVEKVDVFVTGMLEQHHLILARADPARSDFHHSLMRWEISQDAAGTLMRYSWVLEPDVWVPPLLGPWLIERKLRSVAPRVGRNLERLARDRQAPEAGVVSSPAPHRSAPSRGPALP